MDKQRLYTLLTKHQDNACSEDELAELELWYQSLDAGNQSIGQALAQPFVDEMLLQFRQKLSTEKLSTPFYKKYIGRVAAAATIILLLGSGVYFLIVNRSSKENLTEIKKPVIQDITAPKGTKAIITLADGRTVLLDSVINGTLAVEGNVNVSKSYNGQIVYSGAATEIIYNTLTNPRGSMVVNLTLSDGTKVWLNSESSLRYPIAFAGSERKVEVTGEAYFEVAKDAGRKFLVDAKGVVTEVLGTHFNVNSYSDESSTNITLLEGAVKVTKGIAAGFLHPGQQAQVETNIKVVDGINTEEVMAWKEGKFQFDEKTDITNIMRQIARWYDVEVDYKGTITQHFWGSIPRDINVSKVLKILEATGGARFTIEGRKITVMP